MRLNRVRHTHTSPWSSRPLSSWAVFGLLLWLPVAAQDDDSARKAAIYRPVIAELERAIVREVETKQLPAFSIALVDDQDIVWSRGFGSVDRAQTRRATAGTVYRVGSISKLFNAIAVMQLVEQGKLDLDAPLTRYLPEFTIDDPERQDVTLRQLLCHRAGIVRESPVGSYFDPTEPTLAQSVASLAETPRIYPAGSRTKYSNVGVSLAGYVVERVSGRPFGEYVEEQVLARAGMRSSSFFLRPDLEERLAEAVMWSYDGRVFSAPVFQFGIFPAGNLYSTVDDLARFATVLFREGRVPGGWLVRAETLEEMTKVQLAPGTARSFGLGFYLGQLDGERSIGHGGAVYGFASTFKVLPDSKLAVAAVASRDVANAVVGRLADHALRSMRRARRGEEIVPLAFPRPLPRDKVRELAGSYRAESGAEFELRPAFDGGLWLQLRSARARVGLDGDELVADGTLMVDLRLKLVNGGSRIEFRDEVFRRRPDERPSPAPERWSHFIGEYGWDHNELYILEKAGRLHALIEWFEDYPLTEIEPGVFGFPDYGLYHGERLHFLAAGDAVASGVRAASVLFPRRWPDASSGKKFRIVSRRPANELRTAALAASPPDEQKEFRPADLVELTDLDDSIRLDIRYATKNNFMETVFYPQARAFLQRPAAEALVRVHRGLRERGYGLWIFDAYRPWFVTKMFWDATPDEQRMFVADPGEGSRHNRGCAVDLTLYELASGKPVEMVSGYDEFSARAYPHYPGGTSLQRWHRELLRRAMESEGFTVYPFEWWHFDHRDWREYGIANLRFEEISAATSRKR